MMHSQRNVVEREAQKLNHQRNVMRFGPRPGAMKRKAIW